MSTLKVDNIASTSGVTNNRVLQFKHTIVESTSSQSLTGVTDTDITGMSVSITPLSTSSKILLQARWVGEFGGSDGPYNSMFHFSRDGTNLSPADVGNRVGGMFPASINYYTNQTNTLENCTLMYVDSPSSTSSITYTLGIHPRLSQTVYNNRTVDDSNLNYLERAISIITATEIAG